MNTHIFRLHPNTPLRESLEQYCAKHTPQGAAVVTCVGSLQIARLRMAGAKNITERDGPFEILSLVGTWTPEGGHWHISLSDSNGKVWGGHLSTNSIIYTTAEIVIVDIGQHTPVRRYDSNTGYDELYIPNRE